MRIGIISDVHGNYAALRTVLAHMGDVDALWCLGDVVGYGPQPNEVIAAIIEYAHLGIPGNHDWGTLGRLGRESFNHNARIVLEWTEKHLAKEHREYLQELPVRLNALSSCFTLVHASPRDPMWDYLLDIFDAAECFPLFSTRYCLVGHTHVPLVFREAAGTVKAIVPGAGDVLRVDVEPYMNGEANTAATQRMIINPGSVGQPRDGDPRAAYALLDLPDDPQPSDWSATITFERVEYPIKETQDIMTELRFPARLITRLEQGI